MIHKTQSDPQDATEEQVPFEQPWRSHSTATCTGSFAKHNRIATQYCRTYPFDAPVPMHKVPQHMQATMAQRQQRRQKVTWNPQFHCARRSSMIPRYSGDPRTRRARELTFHRNGTSVDPKKQHVSCKS